MSRGCGDQRGATGASVGLQGQFLGSQSQARLPATFSHSSPDNSCQQHCVHLNVREEREEIGYEVSTQMYYGFPKPNTSRIRLTYSKPCLSFWFFLNHSPKLETLGTPLTIPTGPCSQISPESYLNLCLLFPHSFHHPPVTLTSAVPLTHTYPSCLPQGISYNCIPIPEGSAWPAG